MPEHDMPEFMREIFGGGIEPPSIPPDVAAFDRAMAECRKIFMERRGEYGSHFDKPANYIRDNLRTKMTRAMNDINQKNKIKGDTLVDLVCYALMALSLRFKNDTSGNHRQ